MTTWHTQHRWHPKCLVPCQCAPHGTTKCQSVVRLADGTTWHNSIVIGWFSDIEEANIHVLQQWELRRMGNGGRSILIGLVGGFFVFSS